MVKGEPTRLFVVSICGGSCFDEIRCAVTTTGLFVDVKYFQMTDLKIPSDVERRNLKALLLTEETARETFKQQAAVIEKETERQVLPRFNSPHYFLSRSIIIQSLVVYRLLS